MTEVTCPRCQTAQRIEGDGYLCAGCATEWAFARCASCGSAFHMQPGVPTWTCPTCGTRNSAERRRPSMPSPVLIVAAAVLVVAVAAVVVFAGGDDGGGDGDGGGNGDGSSAALATTCSHIQGGYQVLRQQALSQTANQLSSDADALRAEGDDAAAALVDDLVVATQDLAAVIGSGEDDTEANAAVGAAITAVPCGGA